MFLLKRTRTEFVFVCVYIIVQLIRNVGAFRDEVRLCRDTAADIQQCDRK